MERKPSALSVHDRLHSSKSDALQNKTVTTTRKNYPTKSKEVIRFNLVYNLVTVGFMVKSWNLK